MPVADLGLADYQRVLGQGMEGTQDSLWEGSDDGLPRRFHLEALQRCGFQQVAVHWKYPGEGIIGAQKAVG